MAKEIIKSIELNIGDTTIKVSTKQARELYEALAELLGQPKITFTPYIYPTWQPTTITTGGAPYRDPINTTITIQ